MHITSIENGWIGPFLSTCASGVRSSPRQPVFQGDQGEDVSATTRRSRSHSVCSVAARPVQSRPVSSCPLTGAALRSVSLSGGTLITQRQRRRVERGARTCDLPPTLHPSEPPAPPRIDRLHKRLLTPLIFWQPFSAAL